MTRIEELAHDDTRLIVELIDYGNIYTLYIIYSYLFKYYRNSCSYWPFDPFLRIIRHFLKLFFFFVRMFIEYIVSIDFSYVRICVIYNTKISQTDLSQQANESHIVSSIE